MAFDGEPGMAADLETVRVMPTSDDEVLVLTEGLVQGRDDAYLARWKWVSGEAELLAQLPLGSGWIGSRGEGRRLWLGAGEDPRAQGP